MMKTLYTNITLIALLFVVTTTANAGQVTSTFAAGDTLTATKMTEIADAVNDNDSRVGNNITSISNNDTRISANGTRINKIEAQKYITLNPYGALLGGTTTVSSGFGANSGLKLPDVTTASIGFGIVLPPDYVSGDPITVNYMWHTSSVSCRIVLSPNSIAVARVGRTHIVGAGATTGLSAIGGTTLTAPTTSNQSSLKSFAITAPDGTSLRAGDSVIFNVFRNSTNALDTCLGDLVIQAVAVTY